MRIASFPVSGLLGSISVAAFQPGLCSAAAIGAPDPGEASVSRLADAGSSWNDASRATLEYALKARVEHGLDRVTFLSKGPEGESAMARDKRYSSAAIAYATALARGKIDPKMLHEVYTLDRPEADLRAELERALNRGELDSWLGGLAPHDDGYVRLSKAYLSYRDLATAASPVAKIALAGPIHLGESDARVTDIVQQLVDDDYLPATPQSAGSTGYTPEIANAVIALQKDYGIAADGIVGPDTLGVLNMGPGARERALAVALERRRWLSRTPPSTRIDVNTAAARLRYWRDGKLIDERRVIVGEPGRETPMLGSPIYRLVANPTWTIPKSIQNTEMANVGRAYLRAHNMVRRGGWIVQRPGPNNALGLVKFDMRNGHAIYLHDTSARALFDRSQRHLSHGCVRVSDALGFANMLAEQEGVSERWQAARDSEKHRFVPLPREIPVRLIYGNVFVDSGNRIVFRTDPYGWNDKVAEALGFTGAATKRAAAQAIDIGP
ncbi:L,D-transpeptidase family protein [Sphingomonas sp. A2-49]|uniref:L,D-transpeptidase family protein n=1 Tax=Sphingomonas sp. A2-49 TaxID=1391375 RepID=UPI0021CDED18|nr:L,D-transpeptidase family protein [Sphingomonas sp. A2-49]MCU6452973.1 L,D-transpeptidase family protein [Sphingomonas sp. A2-49]